MFLPILYAIVDAEVCRAHATSPARMARDLTVAGVALLQYRDKTGSPQQIAAIAAQVRAAAPAATLILNDRPELVALSSANGVHLGQFDSPFAGARATMGSEAVIGLSTHTDAQVIAADRTAADYLAIGPVFATSTKPDAAPVVGLEGVRRARALTTKPLVAIGGITRENCRSVIDAGADSVAVISGLFSPDETVEEVARDFLRILR